MNKLRCCFSLLLACALVFGVSLPVHAEDSEIDVDVSKTHINMYAYVAGVYSGQIDVLYGETGTVSREVYHDLTGQVRVLNMLTLNNTDSSIFLRAGEEYTLALENNYFRSVVTSDSGSVYTYDYFADNLGTIRIRYLYNDGTYSSWITYGATDGIVIYNSAKTSHTIKLDVAPEKDVLKVCIEEYMYLDQAFDFDSDYGTLKIEGGYLYPMKLSIVQKDKNTGLLSGILDWVKDIGGKVTDMAGTISSGFANIGTWFAELPGKIWGVFEDGIKGLFVPSEESMANMSDKWDELLSDRFGAVYQVCEIVTDSWSGIMSADETNTISIPEVSIPLPGGNDFAFGGQDVKIVPDGFTWLASSVKMVVGMVCTYTFVNGMLRRYDELMGVES